MKSARIILIALFSVFYVCSNAQVFVGGTFGFNTSGGSIRNGNTTTDKMSAYGFNLMPLAGKFLNEKFAAGIGLNISLTGSTNPGNPEIVSRSSSFGFVPFVRYYAITFNKFSVYGQGNVGFSISGSSTKVGGTSADGPRTNTLSLNVFPGLSYDLNEKLSLETSLSFFNLGYYYSTATSAAINDRTSSFNIGGGLGNLFTIGNIKVGAIYKF